MRSTSLRARAGILLAATLLPFSALADTLSLHFSEVKSEVEEVGLSSSAVLERTNYGINEALRADPSQTVRMVDYGGSSADVALSARVTREGEKYRLTYELRSVQSPSRTKTLSYDFTNPSLSDRGSVVMAKELLAEARKLEAAPSTDMEARNEELPTAVDSGSTSGALASERGLAQDSTGREQEPAPSRRGGGRTNLDLGLALGFNSPSGVFGGELEYRVVPWLALNLSGGTGAWGFRVSPLARLYPLGEVRTSPFLEAGMSFNMGGETTSTFLDESRVTEKLMTPVATVAIGMRQSIGPMYMGLRAGWGYRLREDNWRVRDGGDQDIFTETGLGLSQHGGFLASFTLGVTLF